MTLCRREAAAEIADVGGGAGACSVATRTGEAVARVVRRRSQRQLLRRTGHRRARSDSRRAALPHARAGAERATRGLCARSGSRSASSRTCRGRLDELGTRGGAIATSARPARAIEQDRVSAASRDPVSATSRLLSCTARGRRMRRSSALDAALPEFAASVGSSAPARGLLAMLGRFEEAWPHSPTTRASAGTSRANGVSANSLLSEHRRRSPAIIQAAVAYLRRRLRRRLTGARIAQSSSTYAPELGRALCALGRYEEAETLAQLGRELA